MISPYAAFNLKRNPFGELTQAERAELAVVGDQLTTWLEFLSRPKRVIQFLGECGHGKTTRLLALRAACPESAYVYYPESGLRPKLPTAKIRLIDEAQRMGVWRMHQMLKQSEPLAIGTHRDFTNKFRRAGFETLCVQLDRQPTPAELTRILIRRIEASIIDDNCDTQFSLAILSPEVINYLISQYGANIRAMEAWLYEVVQHQVESRPSSESRSMSSVTKRSQNVL